MSAFMISCFLLSLFNLGISTLFKKYYPKQINNFVGYRTPRSMRSQEAWDFANRYSSDLMLKCAVAVFIFQFLLYLTLDGEAVLLTFIGIWIASLLFIILRTEVKLKSKGF